MASLHVELGIHAIRRAECRRASAEMMTCRAPVAADFCAFYRGCSNVITKAFARADARASTYRLMAAFQPSLVDMAAMSAPPQGNMLGRASHVPAMAVAIATTYHTLLRPRSSAVCRP